MPGDFRTRYPGAQPFSDDELSRRLFFGRTKASRTLTGQILTNRLVVVFGRSGFGKTSLLHAGVAPLLREEGHLPLSIRLNDVERGPIQSILVGVESEARRQGVEYVAGSSQSVWSFFRTVELWRGDLLLVPVLVLDQFEEIFTLQGEAAREELLVELGRLVRGVPPPGVESGPDAKPPPVRVVLSMREDYLGLLEDASDRIPEILDHRFRIAPLDVEAAREAIVEPARVEDGIFLTPPFAYEPDAVQSILDFLSSRRAAEGDRGGQFVDPFQLQLICQRVERIVSTRHTTRVGALVTFVEIGGSRALEDTLKRFYLDMLLAVPRKHRDAVQSLCHDHLISPEGRRLSLEEGVIFDRVQLPPETLHELVERRLLRVDNRADSHYYELSHDALVDPVLAVRGWSVLWKRRGAIGGAVVTLLFLAVFAVVGVIMAVASTDATDRNNARTVLGVTLLVCILGGRQFAKRMRENVRALRRYNVDSRLRRSAPPEVGSRAGLRMLGIVIALGFLIVDLFVGIYLAAAAGQYPLVPLPLDWLACCFAVPLGVVFWFRAARRQLSMLMGNSEPARERTRIPLRFARVWAAFLVAGAIGCGLVAGMGATMMALMASCGHAWDGQLPPGVPKHRFMDLPTMCDAAHSNQKAFVLFQIAVGLHVGVIVWVAILMGRRGFARAVLRPEGAPPLSPLASAPAPGALDTLRTSRGVLVATGALAGAVVLSVAWLLGSWTHHSLGWHPVLPSPDEEPLVNATPEALPTKPPKVLGHVWVANRLVEGAAVHLVSADFPYRVYAETRTAPDGSFSFSDGVSWPSRIVATHDPEGVATSPPFRLGDEGASASKELVLSSAGSVHGAVLDENGRPLPGASVAVAGVPWTARVTVDAQGRYQFGEIPEEATTLFVMAAGRRAARLPLRRRGTLPSVVLAPGNSVTGSVLDEDGRPIRARIVACAELPSATRVESEDDGSFELPPSTIDCDAIAEHPEHASSDMARVVGGRPVALRLKAGGAVSGVVVDDRGAPLSRFEVGVQSFLPARGDPFEPLRVRTFEQPDGRFLLSSLAPGTYVLIGRSGWQSGRSALLDVTASAMTRDVRIVVRRGGRVVGTVSDTEKVGLVDATVQVDGVRNPTGDPLASVDTDKSGAYRIDGAPSDLFTLRVSKGGYQTRLIAGLHVDPGETLHKDVKLSALDGGQEAGAVEFGGIGAPIIKQPDGSLVFGVLLPDRPATRKKLEKGDRILRIDGQSTDGLSDEDALQRIRGEPGTSVKLSVVRPSGEALEVTLVRERIVQ